jgi:hypothetical protein
MTARSSSAPGTVDGRSSPRRSRLLWRWAFGAAVVVQLIALYVPDAPAGPGIIGLDKVVHVSIFAVPALAALMLGLRARWVLGILAVHAPISELIQHFVLTHRSGDVFDAVADISGVLVGGLAYVVWNRRQH